jgi:hypothetical protein
MGGDDGVKTELAAAGVLPLWAGADLLLGVGFGLLRASGCDYREAASRNSQSVALTDYQTLAEAALRPVLAGKEAALGRDHPDIAPALLDLALMLKHRGKFGEAEPLLRRVLTIHESALGANHPVVAVDLSHLALLLKERGNKEEAEALLRN